MALPALVMLILFVSVTVLSLSLFVVERLRLAETRRVSAAALYLAQAGIHQALYNFRSRDASGNGYFTKGQTNIDATRYFVIGSNAADNLMVNTVTAALGGGNRDIVNVRLQNSTNSNTITVDRMVVTWNNSVNLRQIRINGSNLWAGDQGSPVNADLSPNFTLNTTPSIYNINRIRFQSNMTGATVTVQFLMTDGSSKTVTVYPASNNNNFTVKSMGRTTLSNNYRTIQAVYNPVTGRIIDHDEINAALP